MGCYLLEKGSAYSQADNPRGIQLIVERIQQSLRASCYCNERVFDYYPALRRVKEYVEKNCSESVTLSAAAKVAAMEPSYFSTFFHAKVGIPFSDWLRRIRIAKAIELMQEQDHSICDVAFAVGFNDLRTFGRAFKRYTNLTPMSFKKACRPENRSSVIAKFERPDRSVA